MKKILLATTALAMTAGMAAADVRVSGDGRMGAVYNSALATQWDLQGRARVSFTMSATGDHGLTFGGTLRVSQNFGMPVPAAVATQNGSVWIQGAGLRVTMGDIDGAVRSRVGTLTGGLGFTGAMRAGNTVGTAQGGDGGNAHSLRADYSFSGVSVSASVRLNGDNPEIGVSFNGTQMGSLPGFVAGLGYQNLTAGNVGNWWVSAQYGFSDITVGGTYHHNGTAGSYRIWADYVMGNITIGARYAAGGVGSSYNNSDMISLGGSYGLGGGARLHGAIGSENIAGVNRTRAEFGVTFAF